MDKKIELIFAGRLSYEKGFDLILNFCKNIEGSERDNKIHLHIFGEGFYSQKLINHDFGFVTFYGRQNKEKVMSVWRNCQYSLMPSRFLETFGLSALDSLSLGVPVIGFKKGGLNQFGDCIIDAKIDNQFTSVVIDQFNKKNNKLSKICIERSRQYSWEERRKGLEKATGNLLPSSDILILSDYSGNIGGIEMYISNIITHLKTYSVLGVGRISGALGSSKYMRYISLPLSLLNIGSALRIVSYINKHPVNIVWRHSVHRVLGWFSLFCLSRKYTGTQLLTIHDFGIIHPFPSQVSDIESLLEKFTFSNRMEAGFERFGNNIILKIFWISPLLFKFIGNFLLHIQIKKNITTILVPSEFMKNVVKNIFEDIDIQVLAHAI